MRTAHNRIAVFIVALISFIVSVAAFATGPTTNEMFPPSRASYNYGPTPHVKPLCVNTNHIYAGWEWFVEPTGTTTRSKKIVCDSSQSATNSGWGWRAATVGTAIIP